MEISLICCLAVIHTVIKKLLYYEEIFNNTLYIQEKKQNDMLSFNPILSQFRAMQSLKRRGPLNAPAGKEHPFRAPKLCWCSLRSQMLDQVLFPYLQH